MKTKLVFTLTLLFLSVGVFAQGAANEHKANRDITRTFNTSDSPVLNVVNKHGNVNISIWQSNAIEVDAKISVTCSNTKKVAAILGCIDINMVQTGNIVTVRTIIDSESAQAIKGRNENCNYQIHISIKAPINTTLNVENKYGNTQIEGTNSSLNATIKYGHLTVGEIRLPSSVVIKYGNVKIQKAANLDLSIKYGNSNIGQMGDLKLLESSYGTHTYNSIGSVTGSVKYDKYNFGVVSGSINLDECKYTNVSVDVLSGSMAIGELSYSNLKVHRLNPSFGSVKVNSRYSDIALSVDPVATCKLSLRTEYGSLSTNLTGVTSELKLDSSNAKAVEMIVGNNPTKTITITNRYGDIIVNKL